MSRLNWAPPSVWSVIISLVPMILLAINLFTIQSSYTQKQADQDLEISNLRIMLANTESVTSAYRATDSARYEAEIAAVRKLEEQMPIVLHRLSALEATTNERNDAVDKRFDRVVDILVELRDRTGELNTVLQVLNGKLPSQNETHQRRRMNDDGTTGTRR